MADIDLRLLDPFAEADEDTGETKQSQNYIHIRIQRTFRTSRFCQYSRTQGACSSEIVNTDTAAFRA